MKQKIKKYLISFLPVIISALLIVSVAYAWTEPTVNPPGNNVAAPINVSASTQTFVDSKILNVKTIGTGILTLKGGLMVEGVGQFVNDLKVVTDGTKHKLFDTYYDVGTNRSMVSVGGLNTKGTLHIYNQTSDAYPAFSIGQVFVPPPPDGKKIINRLMFFPSLTSDGSWNQLVEGGDMALIFDQSKIESGTLVIGPWSSLNRGLKINQNGYVGINTRNPTAILHVVDRSAEFGYNTEPAIIASSIIEGTGGHVAIFPRLQLDAWNPMVQEDDSAIIFGYNNTTNGGAFGAGMNTGSLVIGQWSKYPRGIRIGGDGTFSINGNDICYYGNCSSRAEGKIYCNMYKLNDELYRTDDIYMGFDSAITINSLKARLIRCYSL